VESTDAPLQCSQGAIHQNIKLDVPNLRKIASTKNAPPFVAELPNSPQIFIEHCKGRTILSDNIMFDGL
jgi:hypothetical protein